ncbi:hypothetical protein DVR12_24105 [Chitinophaga silvatica]|uniref:PKD-like family protein n=1 Tax=Chitinophaga silvatica TaxID=2282649 RepID=A0A3E1Y3R8_9BACT|nr:PKD-like family lipoprotein [Chitinophaga silvatica]RFS19318.1 hypothetical protein DVR12_24105 [Chitinophaga silvatica]
MKSINKILYAGLCFTGLLSSGCYKDLGNYNYKEVNNFIIDSFPPSLFVYQFDTLKINPKIAGTLEQANYDDTARFKYRWVLGTANTSTSYPGTIIGTSRVLNARITPSPGPYGLYFEMTDKKTGQIFMQRNTNLTIGSSTYEGWILFSDVKGNAQLDMINYINGETMITRDILSQSPEIPKPLKGPRKVAYINSGTLNAIPPPYHAKSYGNIDKEWIYITTDQGGWKLRNDYFFTQGAWNNVKELVSSVRDSAGFKPLYHGNGESNNSIQDVYMVDENNDIYERNPFRYYVLPINRVLSEGAFRAAPFIGRAYTYSWQHNTVFYDIDRKRFLRSYPESGYCTQIPTTQGIQLFDFNQVGMDMVFMRSMDEINLTYALMKDASNTYWLLTFDARNEVTQNVKIKVTSPEIDKAKFFTIDKTTGVFYYATDSKVYAINKDFPNTYYQVLDVGNRKISWMDEHQFSKGYYSYNGDINYVRNTTNREPFIANWIGVATYDPGNLEYGTGNITFYYAKDYLTAQSSFVKKDEYKGFGKIVSVSYRER